MHTLLYLTWITNTDLLYSTGNPAQCYVPAWMQASLEENGYMYMRGWVPSLFIWNYHDIVCELAIPQYKTKILKGITIPIRIRAGLKQSSELKGWGLWPLVQNHVTAGHTMILKPTVHPFPRGAEGGSCGETAGRKPWEIWGRRGSEPPEDSGNTSSLPPEPQLTDHCLVLVF